MYHTNRKTLFFCYFMDCQTPQKPGGGKTQTWEIAEKAVQGLAELFAGRGLTKALGFCSEPEVATRQSTIFRDLAAAGFWQALHCQIRGYRPKAAAQDYDWEKPLGAYDYDGQSEARTRGAAWHMASPRITPCESASRPPIRRSRW